MADLVFSLALTLIMLTAYRWVTVKGLLFPKDYDGIFLTNLTCYFSVASSHQWQHEH